MTKQGLQDELKKAMLSQDEVKKSTLRMLLSALTYFEIEKGGAGYEATDDDIISVISSQVKQRKDSIEQFELGKRPELAEKERKEMEVLQSFLPPQLLEEEIKSLIAEAILSTGAKAQSDMGKVMGYLAPKIKGKADGSLVSKLVRESLQ